MRKIGNSYLRRAAHALRLRGPLAEEPRARVLHGLLVYLLFFWCFVYFPILRPFAARKPAGAVLVLCGTLIYGFTMALLRRGSLRQASWLFLAWSWLASTVTIVLYGGIHNPVLAEYIVLPIVAAWLLGSRAATAVAAVCLGSSLTMAILQQMGQPLPRYFPGYPLGIWVAVAYTLIMAAVPVIIVLRNLNEALEKRNASLRLLNNIITTSADLIFVKDRQLRTILCNPALARLLGKCPEELCGKTDLENGWDPELVEGNPATGARGFEADDRTALRGETVHLAEQMNIQGEPRSFDTIKLPLRDATGQIIGMFGISRDVTENQHAEEKLKAQAALLKEKVAELARSNADLQQFAYVASHDLKEPLRTVTSFTQLLAQRYRGKMDSDADEFIGYVVDGASRMHALIEDLLAYSRVGTRGKSFELTDSNQALCHAVANLQTATAESGAVITHDELPPVLADSSQLVQLFQNLIGNAIKFRGVEPPCVHVSAAREGTDWVFSVRDNGVGIDPQFADRIFVIFQRLHSSSEYPGTGIGLAVCKRIVERHRGKIWVESEPGKGATFFFTIPGT